MYKKPSARKQIARLTFIYTIMTTAVIALVAFLVLLVLNYRFDEGGSLERRGLIQFASTPSGANIAINDMRINSRTSAKYSVSPGEHTFIMERDGYESWSKTMNVEAGSLVWLDYARLVPTDRPVAEVETYDALHDSLEAPGRRYIILQPQIDQPEFRLVNIEGDSPTGQNISLSSEIYSGGDIDVEHEFEMIGWDGSGRYLLLQHDWGEEREWIVFDTRRPQDSTNITREFAITMENVRFNGTSGNILYALHNNNLRKLNISDGTLSLPLVRDVESFELYDNNEATYLSLEDEDGSSHLGVYREGDTEEYILHSSEDESMSVAITEFLNDYYIAIGSGSEVNIYRGNFTDITTLSASSLIHSVELDEPIDKVEFSPAGNRLLVRAGESYGSYSIEHNDFSQASVNQGSSRDFEWLDGMYLYSTRGDTLNIGEMDGANIHMINDTVEGHAVTLSNRGTYIYSIGVNDDGQHQLQRVRMILN